MSSTFRSVFSHLIQNLDPDFQTLPPLGTAYIPDPAAVLPPPPSLRPAPSSAAPIPAASSSPVEFVPGKRGKPNALWDGQRYLLDRKRGDKSYWKCTLYHQGCTGRLVLSNNVVSRSTSHNHDEQNVEIVVHKSKQKLKKTATTSDFSSKTLAGTCCAEMVDREHRSKLGCNDESLKRMARRARQKSNHHPINPSSLETLVIPPSYLRTASGDNLLIWDSGYSTDLRRSFLFATEDNLNLLQSSTNIVIDGTFKTSPNLFTQLLTVHALYDNGWRIPSAYGLLPGKTEILYTNLLEQLDEAADFCPDTVLTDFEMGLRNAVRNVWPGTTLRGCYFHFKQALWRRFAQSDLVPEYKVPGSPIRTAFKLIGALPFVPVDDIDLAWRLLKPTIPTDMAAFTTYFEHTWIGTSSSSPLFDTWSWNQHETVLARLPRSSNLAEGWHNGFKSLVSCTNPTLWKFLDCLKLEQAITDTKIASFLNRDDPPRRQSKWIKYDERLDRVINSYDRYTDVMEFLTVVAALT